MTDDLAAAARRLFRAIDAEVRKAVPKCPECGRPAGGLLPAGMTPWEAGMVDRIRCPREDCPMRTEGAS